MIVQGISEEKYSHWQSYIGRNVTVFAVPGSYADRCAATVLAEADRGVDELARLLTPDSEQRQGSIEIFLMDPVSSTSADGTGPADRPPVIAADAASERIVQILQPDAQGEPVIKPLTHLLLARW